MALHDDDAGGSAAGWGFELLASAGAVHEARAATMPAKITRLIRMGRLSFLETG
jgi:hypothetical protein